MYRANTRTSRHARYCWNIIIVPTFLTWLPVLNAIAQQPLTTIQYQLLGVSVEVSPSALTVPRSIPSQLNTAVSNGANLPSNAVVRATLRGPSFPTPLEITTTPAQPLPIPPLSQAGTHYIENISLVLDANTTIPSEPADVT